MTCNRRQFLDQLGCGFGSLALAGLLSAMRCKEQTLADQRIIFHGAGSAAVGIAEMICAGMAEESGITIEQARERFWLLDSKGLVTAGRKKSLQAHKIPYARKEEPAETLLDVVKRVKPTILVGTSATPGLFTEEVVRCMAEINERPMIFPLSNPTSKTECSAEEAIRWSGGRAIVATGSPFDPVHFEGRTHRIGQGNNAFVFPGLGLGIVVGRVRRVTDGMFLAAAHALAEQVSPSDLAETAVYPELTRIRECSHAVACGVIRRAVQDGYADAKLLEGLEERVRAAMWYPEYLPCRPA